ncbi:LysR family transcriptional regulator [Porphyrobacter sp. HT-58-2]|uniref:LysR family transcriptional regulator n=1 Tax=Porphyrobacter sp. HT-58-2 TaxID=2023229 RepID=UPI000CDC5A74|nr:LysR family transcriptional regulator [Porphyrobacter sp. HT-58-2]AUX70238.1 LysR family transcriptional regulator [Porphyrobacter sp. HT-58-2]
MKRTHLPLNALRVFDAAARHLSFTRAADELAVTPAAVGQQIRALEDVLGVVLFRRTSKGLELTPEGEAGLDPLREGFLRFEESVAAMQAGQASDRYTIATPREFYAEWLAPRLAKFQSETTRDSGGVQYILAPDEHADFTEANLDLAIRLVDGPGDLQGVQLAPALRVTVAAPEHRDAWIDWPGMPLPQGVNPCIKAGSPGQALASALAGMGRTILPLALAESAIARGSLIALTEPEPAIRSYWLLAPAPQWRSKKVRALVSYLAP